MSVGNGKTSVVLLAEREEPWARELEERHGHVLELVDDPWRLRSSLLASAPGQKRVVVGPLRSMDALNVAAALAADGQAASVALVAEHPSGSLRSRASRARVDAVVQGSELASYLGLHEAKEPKGPEGVEEELAFDLDEPVDGGTPRTSAEGPKVIALPEEPPQRLRRKPFPGRRGAKPALRAAEAETTMDLAPLTRESESAPVLPFAPKAQDAPRADGAKGAPKLVLVSGRGGVGKSAIAALMAATAASWGMDVALVDLDLAFGNLFGYFGLEGPCDLTPVASGDLEAELQRAGKPVAERLTLFGPCAKPEFAETVAPFVTRILDALSASFDLVVVDGGTSWGDGVAQSVQAADRLLVCSDERAGAIGTLSRVGLLAVRLGVARTRICRLLNRCDPRHRDEGFIERADAGFETARPLSIFEGGVEVPELMSSGHAPGLVDLPNPFSESVAHHLALILSELGVLPQDERAQRAAVEKGVSRRGDGFPFLRALAS